MSDKALAQVIDELEGILLDGIKGDAQDFATARKCVNSKLANMLTARIITGEQASAIRHVLTKSGL